MPRGVRHVPAAAAAGAPVPAVSPSVADLLQLEKFNPDEETFAGWLEAFDLHATARRATPAEQVTLLKRLIPPDCRDFLVTAVEPQHSASHPDGVETDAAYLSRIRRSIEDFYNPRGRSE
jgi:hypothetical protein